MLSEKTSRTAGPERISHMGYYMRTSHFLDFIFPTYRLYFSHSAVGSGWTTDIVLLNPLQKEVEATVEVFDSGGVPRITEKQFSLKELSVVEWELPAGEEEVETGGVVVSSPEKLSGFLRFRHKDDAATSVGAAPVAGGFMVPLSSSADRVGLAVYNADDQDLTVVLRIGQQEIYKTIPAQGKIAAFVDEYFPGSGESTDALIVQTDPPDGRITALSLEMINGHLVTLPAVPLQ